MNKRLVSVVIPTYSRPVSLDRAIQSVLHQTYKNIEIIIVDDNNPNTAERKETEKIMKKYKNNKKVKYIQHEKNKNGSAARNTGWKNSKGYYITFLDDDDVITDNRIEIMVNKMDSLDDTWGMCYTGYNMYKENGKTQKSAVHKSGYCYVDALMRTLYMGSGSNLFLKKSVVDEIDGYDETFKRNQDLEFLARACEKYKIYCINENLLIIYQEGNRKKRSFEELEAITEHYLKTFEDRINKLPKKDKKRVMKVIALERFRDSLISKEVLKGIKILIQNKVGFIMFIKYICYLIYRVKSHKSFGFDGKRFISK